LASRFTASSTSTLGLCSAIFTAAGLVLFEGALRSTRDDTHARRGLMSANGTFARRGSQGAHREHQVASLRDVAVVMIIVCGVATYLIEPSISPHAISWEPVYRQLHGDWKTLHYHRTIQECMLMVPVSCVSNVLMFYMVSHHRSVVNGCVFFPVPARYSLVFSRTQGRCFGTLDISFPSLLPEPCFPTCSLFPFETFLTPLNCAYVNANH
jgi:hypothetical protein